MLPFIQQLRITGDLMKEMLYLEQDFAVSPYIPMKGHAKQPLNTR